MTSPTQPAANPPPARLSDNDMTFWLLLALSLVAIGLGFVFTPVGEKFTGWWTILTSPSGLITDYIEISSMGSTFFGAGVLMLASILVVRWNKLAFSGPIIAGIFTLFGFAMFGKNLVNAIPIALGVALYARIDGKRFRDYLVPALFATSLAPAVSFIAFGTSLPVWAGLPLGYGLGIIIGLLVPALAPHFLNFHRGHSLYNVGFTAGIVGMIAVAVLSLFDIYVEGQNHLSSGNNLPLAVVAYSFSAVVFVAGFIINGRSTRGLLALMRRSGKLITDFVSLDGAGVTLMNMGIMGAVATTYVLAVGGDLTGPSLGGIFTIIGFAAFGKHARNTIPIFAGVALATLAMGASLGSTGAVVTALFATTLAPVAGVFGPVWGLVAGFLHMALVSNVVFLHGGLNLYNNGFAAGFVALVLIPFIEGVHRIVAKAAGRDRP
ncbi:MAG: DUF1576 domain-containing protein [Cellulomonadaceae bacterium]|jgi:hypothetical protein|nr:DUF1576 domain-containing protein [Cellulomonadaceae bacterium]